MDSGVNLSPLLRNTLLSSYIGIFSRLIALNNDRNICSLGIYIIPIRTKSIYLKKNNIINL